MVITKPKSAQLVLRLPNIRSKTSIPFHFYFLRETVQPGAMEIVHGVVGLGLAGVKQHCEIKRMKGCREQEKHE